MRTWIGIFALVALGLGEAPASAQDKNTEVEALRRELENVRRQFDTMKDGYEKAINTLADRLKAVEERPAPKPEPVTAAPPPATPYLGDLSAQAPAGSTPSLKDLARPREPFGLYERRGAGQLLFDMGVTGDFIANFTQRNVDKANAGTFAGQENRFFPREIELSFFGQIDPYARAEVRIEAGEEDAGEITVRLAEANFTLMALPFGTQLKIGQMRNRFGLLNEIHEHDRPQIDTPNVLTRFFGPEGLVERGAEFVWVAPLPFYLQFIAGIFDGDNETLFGRGKISEPLVTGRLRTFLDFDELGAVQFGASVASGSDADRQRSTVVGVDGKYKYKPEGWQHALLTVGGEWLYLNKHITTEGVDEDGDGIFEHPPETRIRNKFGWYTWVDVQPWRRWLFGFRYDWTEFPDQRGREWAVEPYITFMPSEFLRFRLGYKHTERDKRDGFGDNGGSARIVDEILLQATFILGAHPAHPF
jgi:hypothetical protein